MRKSVKCSTAPERLVALRLVLCSFAPRISVLSRSALTRNARVEIGVRHECAAKDGVLQFDVGQVGVMQRAAAEARRRRGGDAGKAGLDQIGSREQGSAHLGPVQNRLGEATIDEVGVGQVAPRKSTLSRYALPSGARLPLGAGLRSASTNRDSWQWQWCS